MVTAWNKQGNQLYDPAWSSKVLKQVREVRGGFTVASKNNSILGQGTEGKGIREEDDTKCIRNCIECNYSE